ncbi:MAG: hypothetical protein RIR70_1525, partial [Pseudomonadota bacterium]
MKRVSQGGAGAAVLQSVIAHHQQWLEAQSCEALDASLETLCKDFRSERNTLRQTLSECAANGRSLESALAKRQGRLRKDDTRQQGQQERELASLEEKLERWQATEDKLLASRDELPIKLHKKSREHHDAQTELRWAEATEPNRLAAAELDQLMGWLSQHRPAIKKAISQQLSDWAERYPDFADLADRFQSQRKTNEIHAIVERYLTQKTLAPAAASEHEALVGQALREMGDLLQSDWSGQCSPPPPLPAGTPLGLGICLLMAAVAGHAVLYRLPEPTSAQLEVAEQLLITLRQLEKAFHNSPISLPGLDSLWMRLSPLTGLIKEMAAIDTRQTNLFEWMHSVLALRHSLLVWNFFQTIDDPTQDPTAAAFFAAQIQHAASRMREMGAWQVEANLNEMAENIGQKFRNENLWSNEIWSEGLGDHVGNVARAWSKSVYQMLTPESEALERDFIELAQSRDLARLGWVCAGALAVAGVIFCAIRLWRMIAARSQANRLFDRWQAVQPIAPGVMRAVGRIVDRTGGTPVLSDATGIALCEQGGASERLSVLHRRLDAAAKLSLQPHRDRESTLAGEVGALHRKHEELAVLLNDADTKLTVLRQQRDALLHEITRPDHASADDVNDPQGRLMRAQLCASYQSQLELNQTLGEREQAHREAVGAMLKEYQSRATQAASHLQAITLRENSAAYRQARAHITGRYITPHAFALARSRHLGVSAASLQSRVRGQSFVNGSGERLLTRRVTEASSYFTEAHLLLAIEEAGKLAAELSEDGPIIVPHNRVMGEGVSAHEPGKVKEARSSAVQFLRQHDGRLRIAHI